MVSGLRGVGVREPFLTKDKKKKKKKGFGDQVMVNEPLLRKSGRRF